MRTFSEINRDLQKCESKIANSKTNKEYLKYIAMRRDLIDEKELLWNTLYEPSKLR